MSISKNTTFVTAYYPIKRDEIDDNLKQIKQLADTGINLIFFHDSTPELLVALKTLPSNVKSVNYSLSQLKTYELIDAVETLELPEGRTKSRDGLIIDVARTELLALGLKHCDTEYIAWLDFNITKGPQFAERINNLAPVPDNKITITGPNAEQFYGIFFLCRRMIALSFHLNVQAALQEGLKGSKLMYDVDLWRAVEQKQPSFINRIIVDALDESIFLQAVEAIKAVEPVDLNKKRIILLTMVKNEERIIERLIRSALNVVDAVCVSDTGSTDKTCEIVERLKSELSIPVYLYQDEWKNFGHNRSLSFTNCQRACAAIGWRPENTYGILLDGDMVLKVQSSFDKEALNEPGYMMSQKSHALDYYNTRLVRLSDGWKCVGVTHEYWDGPGKGKIEPDKIYIEDIGDGGCKADKFERDIRLLTEGLAAEPNNGRYHFYLAQSYKDVGQHDKAIEIYKKRIVLGGWDEEIWYSHYMIAKMYLAKKKIFKAEKWVNKAYEFRKCRAEPLYMLVNHFRECSNQQHKAMHYYKLAKPIPYPNDLLFVEKNIYSHLLDYEYTILHYYVSPNNNFHGAKMCLNYLNKHRHNWDNVFTNIGYYLPRLCEYFDPKRIVTTCTDTDFRSSSVSLIRHSPAPGMPEKLLANIRYVNYKIMPDGSYEMMENGKWHPHHWVRTKNAYQYFDLATLEPASDITMMDGYLTDVQQFHNTHIRGIEDVRLFNKDGRIHYNATTREWSYDGKNRIITGIYDMAAKTFTNNCCMKPPTPSECEKNWISHRDNIIYNWSPLQIGKVNQETKQVEIHTTHATPNFFERVRGSSSLIEFDGKLWCVTHSVRYEVPRKYYHHLIVLDPATYKPVQMSAPFVFCDTQIEYVLGFEYDGAGNFIMAFSVKDADSQFVKVPVSWFKRNMMIDL